MGEKIRPTTDTLSGLPKILTWNTVSVELLSYRNLKRCAMFFHSPFVQTGPKSSHVNNPVGTAAYGRKRGNIFRANVIPN